MQTKTLLYDDIDFMVRLPIKLFITEDEPSWIEQFDNVFIMQVVLYLQAFKNNFNEITFCIDDVIGSFQGRMNYKHDNQTYDIPKALMFLYNQNCIERIGGNDIAFTKMKPKHYIKLRVNMIEKNSCGEEINYVDIPWSIINKIHSELKNTKIRRGALSLYMYLYIQTSMLSYEATRFEIQEALIIKSKITLANYIQELVRIGLILEGRSVQKPTKHGMKLISYYTFERYEGNKYQIIVDGTERNIGDAEREARELKKKNTKK